MTANTQPLDLAQVIKSSIFPTIDTELRSGKHINFKNTEYYEFLTGNFLILQDFYKGYGLDLICAPENFIYLNPTTHTLLSRAQLNKFDMLLGKIICNLFLNPDKLTLEGVFTLGDIETELFAKVELISLTKLLSLRSSDPELDRKRIAEKIMPTMHKLQRLGMVEFIQENTEIKFFVLNSIVRFSIDAKESTEYLTRVAKLYEQGSILQEEPTVLQDNITDK